MITITEAIEYFKQYEIVVDQLAIERWIRQRKITAVRSNNGDREWRIIKETLIPIILEHLREENLRLKKQLYDRLNNTKSDQGKPQEEPPF